MFRPASPIRAASTSPRRCWKASTATTACSARPARAKRRFEQADWHGQQRAQRERIEFYDKRVDEAAERLQTEFQAGSLEMDVAAGQAALHRPADQPPPARAGRDLLQLGHPRSCTAHFNNDFIFVRPGGQHRIHRERRARRRLTYRAYYPTPERCETLPHRRQLPAAVRVRGPPGRDATSCWP